MFSVNGLINLILPPRCAFNGEIFDSPGTVSPKAWATLSFITAPCCDACGFPFAFSTPDEQSGKMFCGPCLKDRPNFTRARAALVYDDTSRDFILGFKHGDRTQNVVTMLPWLKQAGADILADADLLIPVPLHRWRLLKRRYNQAALMAAALGRSSRKKFIVDGLLRVRATPTQGHLNAGERRQNVRKAFIVHPKRASRIQGKNILLIDDVYTTGATVRECAAALLATGAARVDVLTLARVVRASHGI